MFLTGVNEIINVWANDANKLIVFISVIVIILVKKNIISLEKIKGLSLKRK